jgi:uncharacterized protein YlzI (FlbEa/FlbD family)
MLLKIELDRVINTDQIVSIIDGNMPNRAEITMSNGKSYFVNGTAVEVANKIAKKAAENDAYYII